MISLISKNTRSYLVFNEEKTRKQERKTNTIIILDGEKQEGRIIVGHYG